VIARVVGDALALALSGLAAGAIACLFLAKLMTPLLFGVGANDATAMATAAAALLLVAILAAVVPAARASMVSPVIAMRGDRGSRGSEVVVAE
jgi:ABC-type antimicrobial peptide transport system permease subunit